MMSRRSARHAPAPADGFTLIEVMVVVLILGLLATLVMPDLIGTAEEAKVRTARIDCKTIRNQAEQFQIAQGRVPTLEDLRKPDTRGNVALRDYVRDPWNRDYVLRPDDHGHIEVISLGPDGVEGSDDDLSSTTTER